MKWLEYQRTTFFNYMVSQADGTVLGFRQVFGTGIDIVTVSFHKNHSRWYYDQDSIIKVAEKIMQKKEFVDHFIKRFKETVKETLQISKEIKETDLRKLDNIQLYNLAKMYFDAYYVCWYWGNLSDPLDYYLNIELKNRLNNLLNADASEIAEYFTILSTSTELSLYNLYRKTILEFMSKINKDLKDIKAAKTKYNKELSKIADEFYYINLDYSYHKKLTPDEVWSAVKDVMKNHKKSEEELEKLTNHKKMIITKKKELIEKLGIKGELLSFIEMIDKLSVHHDQRKRDTQICIYNVQKMYEEIARRLYVSADHIKWMHPEEVPEAIKTGKINKKEIEQRMERCLYVTKPEGHSIYLGKEIYRVEQKLGISEKKDQQKVKGTCASKGVVTGRVKVVFVIDDFHKIEKGDILVTGMTSPKFTPILNKVSAIVTDEGGITCHAAIVARELNIPCIIGTKNATKVLRDNDEVEVDANKGVVRKIK